MDRTKAESLLGKKREFRGFGFDDGSDIGYNQMHEVAVQVLMKENDKGVEKLNDIGDICVDYDGYRTVKGLKELIDDIKDYAYKSAKAICGGDS